jgi:hypothetical protein
VQPVHCVRKGLRTTEHLAEALAILAVDQGSHVGAQQDQGVLQSFASSSVSILPEGYTTRVKEVAERRIVLAGYRIADLLKQAFDGRIH